MKRIGKGSGRGLALQLFVAMPLMTVLLAVLGAKLILSEMVGEDSGIWIACVITGVVSFLACLYCSCRVPQKRFLWGLTTAAAYACLLLLGNLLFFGIGYGGNIPAVIGTVILCGAIGSILGAGRRR